MPIELWLSVRFLRDGRAQTALIFAGVSVGVGVIIFLSALIAGLQTRLIEQTLGSQPHVVIEPEEERARPQLETPNVIRSIERPAQRLRSIRDWQKVLDDLAADPDVVAVSPVVAGPALAVQASASRSATVFGVEPDAFDRVIPLASRITEGELEVSGAYALIGTGLAADLGTRVGDELRLVTAEGRSQLVEVRGIFELGTQEADDRWVVVSLRSGQTLLDLVGGVSRIDVRVRDVFEAPRVAQRIAGRVGLPTTSWTERNAQLLVGLESQSRSSEMIQLFVVIAVAMGIASVLAVSVVQRRREIGILRAMGTSRRSIQAIFLYQGAIVGLVGSAVGSGIGAALSRFFESSNQAADGSPLFPFDLGADRFATAMIVATLTGIVAAALPARRAAKMDPAVAIRSL